MVYTFQVQSEPSIPKTYRRENFTTPTKSSPFRKEFKHPKVFDINDFVTPNETRGFVQNAISRKLYVPESFKKVYLVPESGKGSKVFVP